LWWLVGALLDLAWFLVIAAVVASWLIAFGVLNMQNQIVRQIVRTLDSLTEPVFRPVRRIIPPIGGLDLSPLIVLLAIGVLQVFFDRLFASLIVHAAA
jgi:YggT family protein